MDQQFSSVIGGLLLLLTKDVKEINLKRPIFASVIGGIPLVAGPLERGSTVFYIDITVLLSSCICMLSGGECQS